MPDTGVLVYWELNVYSQGFCNSSRYQKVDEFCECSNTCTSTPTNCTLSCPANFQCVQTCAASCWNAGWNTYSTTNTAPAAAPPTFTFTSPTAANIQGSKFSADGEDSRPGTSFMTSKGSPVILAVASFVIAVFVIGVLLCCGVLIFWYF